MRKYFRYLLIGVLSLASCQKILFNEEERTRVISTGSFTSARIYGIYNLVIVQDSADRVVITGSNGIDEIEASVINDTLVVDDGNGFSLNPGRNTLELHFRQLEYLVTADPVNLTTGNTITGMRFSWDGIGEIAEATLALDYNLVIICNSANTLGHINLSGKAETLVVFNRYGGSVFADSLICSYADITNESAGNVHVNASDYLTAYIWGPGNIYFHGDPITLIRGTKGTGNLIRIR